MISLKDTRVHLDAEELFFIPKFQLGVGHKVGLLAPNGTGKSVFMQQLIAKEIPHSLSLASCMQQLPDHLKEVTLNDWAAYAPEGFNYHEFYRLGSLLGLDFERPVATFSGGQERKAALIYTMCQQAQLYLFDEPTNHLDLPSILWLEQYIKTHLKSFLIVSHDLQFLEHTVDGYWAIHEKLLRYYDGSYEDYQQKRELEEIALMHEHARNVISLKQEERYRERGVTARRKRNQKRVEKLHHLRAVLQESEGVTENSFSGFTHRSLPPGQMIVELLGFQPTYYDGQKANLLPPLTKIITRKDKIAIVGGNGRGKTTLLRALLEPQDGPTLRHREHLKIAFLDQQRTLDNKATPIELVAGDSSHITLYTEKGSYQLHPLAYLQRFGLEADHARTPYGKLSGGQKMKVCLAKALALPVDVLVLDEPTNDLDIEAVEELAELLIDFNGLVLFVSHDRHLINQCATETWYLTPKKIIIHPGGFEQRFMQMMQQEAEPVEPVTVKVAPSKAKASLQQSSRSAKAVIMQIEKTETRLKALEELLMEPSLYEVGQKERLKQVQQEQNELTEKLVVLYKEWEACD
jgi:ATP-binding cassette subfamily F protein uup